MATESVRVYSFSFNGSQTRQAIPLSPARFLGLRPRPSSSLTSSSLSHFFGNVRLSSSNSSKLSILRQQSRRNLSVVAMAADGIFLLLFYLFLFFNCYYLVEFLFFKVFSGYPIAQVVEFGLFCEIVFILFWFLV